MPTTSCDDTSREEYDEYVRVGGKSSTPAGPGRSATATAANAFLTDVISSGFGGKAASPASPRSTVGALAIVDKWSARLRERIPGQLLGLKSHEIGPRGKVSALIGQLAKPLVTAGVSKFDAESIAKTAILDAATALQKADPLVPPGTHSFNDVVLDSERRSLAATKVPDVAMAIITADTTMPARRIAEQVATVVETHHADVIAGTNDPARLLETPGVKEIGNALADRVRETFGLGQAAASQLTLAGISLARHNLPETGPKAPVQEFDPFRSPAPSGGSSGLFAADDPFSNAPFKDHAARIVVPYHGVMVPRLVMDLDTPAVARNMSRQGGGHGWGG